ncbi:aminopeptidase P family protein [Rahnella woolbedingensis]|uniref:Aminopeptidase P family protein n=1 Tax=Rahnella woolbedingensis TaxID=1510574 RepID=A0A419N8I7_9GAMM|nr:aminopeptidase P family protein [Rahnella woolbedingensis]RJT43859.1 aminopeptidase P family protein [Rahnella woolbedingensis]
MSRQQRLDVLRQHMAERNMAAVLLTDRFSKYAIAELYSASGYVLVTLSGLWILVDGRYSAECSQNNPDVEVLTLTAEHPLSHFLRQFIGTERLFADASAISHLAWQALESQCGLALQHRDASVLRVHKYPDEIAKIREAAVIADRALQTVMPFIRPGITEKKLADHIEMAVRQAGGSKTSFDTVVVSGTRGALPHGRPTDKKLMAGELVTIDFGAVYQHYCSDMTRTFALGNASEQLKAIYDTVLIAQQAARDAVRPGIRCQELDAVARNIIASAGYGEYFSHNLGHGLGLDVHEAPALSPQNAQPLESGMVITLEPGIYVPGLGGVRIEDDVLVTERGGEVLTNSPRAWGKICL